MSSPDLVVMNDHLSLTGCESHIIKPLQVKRPGDYIGQRRKIKEIGNNPNDHEENEGEQIIMKCQQPPFLSGHAVTSMACGTPQQFIKITQLGLSQKKSPWGGPNPIFRKEHLVMPKGVKIRPTLEQRPVKG